MSGIALAPVGPAPATLIKVHVVSFLVWLVTIVIHVVAYLRPARRSLADEIQFASGSESAIVPAVAVRLAANLAALAGGAVAAAVVWPTATAWNSWLIRGEDLPVGLSLVALVIVLKGATAFVTGAART